MRGEGEELYNQLWKEMNRNIKGFNASTSWTGSFRMVPRTNQKHG